MRTCLGIGLLVLGLLSTIACTNDQDQRIVVGVSFATLAEERWSREKNLMKAAAERLQIDLVVQSADGDESRQNDQIENLITQGVDALIVIAQNADAASAAVTAAQAEGISCIAYDRFIPNPDLALYVSFDSVKVGEKQAAAIVAKQPEGRFFWLGGSPTDDNAHRVRQGHLNILQPLIDAGKVTLVGEQWCDGWRPEEALKHMENALTATENGIDAVLASNDGTAGAAIQALTAQGLAGKVPVSGQDAELAACQRVAAGTQEVTIFKDVRQLVDVAMASAGKLATGEKIDNVSRQVEGVDAVLLDVVPVTSKNLFETIVQSGYHSKEEVYRTVPRIQWPQ